MVSGLERKVAVVTGAGGGLCPGDRAARMSLRYDQEFLDTVIPHLPLRRFGEALDIANAALSVASDETADTTGQWLSPSGGLVIC